MEGRGWTTSWGWQAEVVKKDEPGDVQTSRREKRREERRSSHEIIEGIPIAVLTLYLMNLPDSHRARISRAKLDEISQKLLNDMVERFNDHFQRWVMLTSCIV